MSSSVESLALSNVTAPRRGILLAMYWLVLVTATHWPAAEPMVALSWGDKIVHFVAYAVLAWMIAWTSDGRLRWMAGLALAWLLATACGGLDELTQPPFNRTADPYDWLADALGAATGVAVYAWSGVGRRRTSASEG